MKKAIILLSIGMLLLSCGPQENPDPEKTKPTVTTGQITGITTTTATCSDNNVTDDGGADVTVSGVCWSTTTNPTTEDSKTEDGVGTRAGTGTFTSNLTGLTPNTTYYVRAYATNSEGTAYGVQRTFTTNAEQGTPTVNTGNVTDITTTTANCSGDVTAEGESVVTARGVCWGTSEEPDITDSKTEDGEGTGAFTSNLTGLSPNTTAYATNTKGTAYGEQKTFTTNQAVEYGTFTDSRDGNVYKMVTIGEQTWMAENLAYLPSVVGYSTGSEDEGHEAEAFYYVYGYDDTSVSAAKATANYQTYGVLYNWYAAMTDCHEGWHLPSHDDWTQLETYLANNGYNCDGSIGPVSGDNVRLYIAKSLATDSGWRNSSNQGAIGNTDYPEYRNKSGFSALPGGFRDHYDFGRFQHISVTGTWWSSSEHIYNTARVRRLFYNACKIQSDYTSKNFGYSVRCVKD